MVCYDGLAAMRAHENSVYVLHAQQKMHCGVMILIPKLRLGQEEFKICHSIRYIN